MKRLFTLLVVLVAPVFQCSAATWYVSPNGAGSKDGTSVGNAWSNLNSVVWGVLGVNTNDTLYVLDTHILSMTTENFSSGVISPVSGVTIRGDSPGRPGTIFCGAIWAVSGRTNWIGPDANNVYYSTNIYYTGNPSTQFIVGYEVDGANFIRLLETNRSSWASQPSTHSYNQPTNFVKTSYAGAPTNNIALIGPYGWTFNITGLSNITFQSLRIIGPVLGGGSANANHINFTECTMSDEALPVLAFGNNFWTFNGCDISYALNGGIYIFNNADPLKGADHVLITNCAIHDIDVTNYTGMTGGDGHGIGVRTTASNITVTHNEIYLTESAIEFFGEAQTNIVISYNFIHDTHAGNTDGGGISLTGGSALRTGVSIYGNVILNLCTNCPQDYQGLGIDGGMRTNCYTEILNNTIVNAKSGIYATPINSPINAKIVNNIIVNPRQHFLFLNAAGTTNTTQIDYNLYYKTVGNPDYVVLPAITRDQHSVFQNPQFVSANPSVATDFAITHYSPAAMAGTNAGVVKDFNGTNFTTPPSIGAFTSGRQWFVAKEATTGILGYTEKQSVLMPAGVSYPHASVYLNNKLYVACETQPSRLVRYNKPAENLNDFDVITFTADGAHDYARGLIYVASKGKLYIIFHGFPGSVVVSEVDPVTLAFTDVITTPTTDHQGERLCASSTNMFILVHTITGSSGYGGVVKYKLSDWSEQGRVTLGTTGTIGTQPHAMQFDGTNIYMTGAASPGWAMKMDPNTLTFTSTNFQAGDNTITDTFAMTDTNIWAGPEVSGGVLVRVNKSDLSLSRFSNGTTYGCYGLFFDGTYIWNQTFSTPGILQRITTQNSNIVNTVLAETSPTEMATDGTNYYVESFESPMHVIRVEPIQGGLNNGTSYYNAWNEMSNIVWSSIQPGDIINISGNLAGTTNNYFSYINQFNANANNGTEANPITIRLDPNHPGNIHLFAGTYINRDYYTLDFRNNTNYIPNTTIDTLNTTYTNCAIQIWEQQNNHAVNYGSGIGQKMYGVHVMQAGNASAIGGGQDYNALEINGNSGGRLITNCDIAYNVLGESYGFGFEASGFASQSFNLLRFHHNIIEYSHDNYIQGDGNMRIDHNLMWKWSPPGVGHPDFIQGISSHMIIDHNIMIDNPGTAIYIEANSLPGWDNFYMYDNLIYSSTQGWHDGITLTGHDASITNALLVTNIWVVNNTFGDANGASVYVQNNGTTRRGSTMTNVHFLNNAIAFQFPTNGTQPVLQFYTNTSDINGVTGLTYAQSDVEVDYNNISVGTGLGNGIYYSGQGQMQGTPYTNFTDFGLRTAYKHNTNAAATYVSLTNFDFRVGADTALKGLGTNVISTLTNACPDIGTDLIGNARPLSGALDAGAYQSDPTLKMWLTFHDWGGQAKIVADDSGFTNNAIPYSAVSNSPSIGVGQDGKIAASFLGNYPWPGPPAETGGSIQYLAVTNLGGGIADVTNGTITVWAWYQTNSSRVSAILDSGYPDTDGSWYMGRYFGNQTYFRMWTNSQIINALAWPDIVTLDVNNFQVQPGGWKHYAVTWTNISGTMQLISYYNGSPTFTNNIGNFPAMRIRQVTTPNYLGISVWKHQGGPALDPLHMDPPNVGWFGGAMDDMRFYTRTLSSSDIAAIASGSGVSGENAPFTNNPPSSVTNLGRVTNLHVKNAYVGPPQASSEIFDNFVTVSNVDLAVHRTTVGNYLWTHQGGLMNDISATSEVLDLDDVNSSYYNVSHVMSTSNYSVECTLNYPTTADAIISGSIFGRYNVSTQEGYYIIWTPFTQLASLKKEFGGSNFTIGGPATLTGLTHTFRLVMNGTTISGYADGVLIATVVDTSISAAGRAGIGPGLEGVDQGSKGANHFSYKNFRVTVQ